MKIVHTSDWHVGRTLRGRSRADEHEAVLAEVAALAGREDADLVLVTGDLFDALSWPGLWRFVLKYPRATLSELRQSFSRSRFAKALQRLVPELDEEDLLPGPSGVRAQAMGPDGRLIDDFELLERTAAIHVLNAPSPAATASLAIGEEIASRVL